MKISKKFGALIISTALVAAFGTVNAFAATYTKNQQSTLEFTGNVDFWESTFADEYRTPVKCTIEDGYAHFKWTSRNGTTAFKLKMKIKHNSSNAVVASKVVSTMNEPDSKAATIVSNAMKDEYYRLYLTRENILDKKTLVGGNWAP